MTEQEFTDLFTRFPHLEMKDGEGGAWFRWNGLSFYDDRPHDGYWVSKEKIREWSPDFLVDEIKRGVDVDHIGRVTGYMVRYSAVNPGKRGEIRDRYRNDGAFGGEGVVPAPRPWAMIPTREASL